MSEAHCKIKIFNLKVLLASSLDCILKGAIYHSSFI